MSEPTAIGPMAAIRQFCEAFNNHDVELAQATFTDKSWIIDDFPPHQWAGNGATTKWFQDMDRMSTEYACPTPR